MRGSRFGRSTRRPGRSPGPPATPAWAGGRPTSPVRRPTSIVASTAAAGVAERRHDTVTEPLHGLAVAAPDLLVHELREPGGELGGRFVASFLGQPRVAREVEERERRRTLGRSYRPIASIALSMCCTPSSVHTRSCWRRYTASTSSSMAGASSTPIAFTSRSSRLGLCRPRGSAPRCIGGTRRLPSRRPGRATPRRRAASRSWVSPIDPGCQSDRVAPEHRREVRRAPVVRPGPDLA